MKYKVLILGVAGFTGKHFSNYIFENKLTDKFEFIGVDNCDCEENNFSIRKIDLTNFSNIYDLLIKEKPDYIINLIGNFASNDFLDLLKINVGISQNIMTIVYSERIPVNKILLIGSAAEYGSNVNLPISEDQIMLPVSLYGLSKVYQSQVAQYYFNNHGINVNVARPFNLLGKGLSKSLSISSFVNQIKEVKNGGNISVGNINTKRDFIDIYDAIDAYWKLLLFGKSGEIYNVCSGTSYSIKEIIEILIKISGKKINIIVEEKLVKTHDIQNSYGDNSKLQKVNNWYCKENLVDSLTKMF